MAFLNLHKTATTKSELDIFAVPPTQNSVESGQMQCYRPFSTLSDNSPIEFLVPGHGDEYIDLTHTMIYITAKINIKDSANEKSASDEANVAPINNWLHSMFSQVDIYLNQKCITPPSNCYNYRSYVENLLNYGDDAKTTHLATNFWYQDTAGNMDKTDTANAGYAKRRSMTKNSQIVDMYGNLHCDLFNQDKYLLNGVEMKIKLQRAKTEFQLMATGCDPSITILDAILYVRKIKINPSILIAHARALSVATAKYPITRVDVKTISIPTGVQNKTIDNLYLGQLPKRCIIGFIENKAFNGDLILNPYNFQSFNYNFLSLYLDSVQIPSTPLTPDFTKNLYTRAYHSLFSGSGIHFSDTGNCITKTDYPFGYCLAAFDLTSDLSSNESHWNIIKSGCLRFEVRFDKPLTNTITAIIFAEFDNVIEIDINRNVSIDFNS